MATFSRRPARSHQGPSAFGSSPRRFLELTVTLARTDFKLRYFGSALGYFWQLIRPLLFFGVIYVFFTEILHVGKGVPHYGVYLLTGIVLWTFFGEATGNAVPSLVNREAMLRKVRFPRLAVPIGTTLTSLFNLCMNGVAVIVFALINGVSPAWSWLEMIPIVLGFLLLALGFGMLLSALYVRFRDVQPIWDVVGQVLFYATPIMYPAYDYGHLERWALLNPFGLMITQMGHAFLHFHQSVHLARANGQAFIGQPFPSAQIAAGGWGHVAISLAFIPAIFLLGLWVFTREAPRVAENL
ncbi:ABC transporter permease [Conexibacter sp. DBS9H8]|uniref:ABC transporter permease n=1 Tax=Conexibacter sp. DBS9H8 TaxID=2937801 RepID=UPI00200DB976|nr:ABC transporter permease [Conexibacter sp. DBS9H8]